MDEYRLLNKHFNKSSNNKEVKHVNSWLKIFISKVLICFIIFLLVSIFVKTNPKYKEIIYNNVYEKNFSFAKVNELYTKYFGEIFPVKKIMPEDIAVFSEKLVYSDANLYNDGVKLTVSDNYLVPVMESGIVVFIGEKELYGKTVIIQQVDGKDVWYSNIIVGDIKIYDYVDKGKMLGSAIDKTFYLVFQKDGKFLDYKEFIK